jgi:protein-export membrane protein SecD
MTLAMRALAIVFIGLLACGGEKREKKPAAPGSRLQIVYDIDLDKAIDDRARELRRDLEAALADAKIDATVRTPVMPLGALTVVASGPEKKQPIEALIESSYGGIVEPRECAVEDGPYAICVAIVASSRDALKKSALAAAVTTIRNRLDAVKVEDPTVVEKAGQIVVEFPANDPQGLAIRALVSRTGKLEFKVVDSNSTFMQKVFAQVGNQGPNGDATDADAIAQGIKAEADMWRTDDGATQADFYLLGPDRIVLEKYFAKLAALEPSFRVPDDREIGYELVTPHADAKDQRPYWRTYYLERDPRLTGTAIANAQGTFDPNTNRPVVLLDFNRHGATIFGELTAQIVGKKLATILDGNVKSAPIINSPIRGGRASITMGGSDPRAQERERDELVSVLKAGALPSPLREVSSKNVP